MKMRRDQQFRSAVTVVQQKLQTALETMLIHNENVSVIFEPEQNGIKVTIETETPLTRGLGRMLNRDPLIKGIDQIIWTTPEGDSFAGKVTLEFSAIAHAIPSGTLTLKGPITRTIVLKGYPHPFQVTFDEKYEEVNLESEQLYPKEVREMYEATQ